MRFLSFGECPNGFRVVVAGAGDGAAPSRSRSPKRPVAEQGDWYRRKAEEALRLRDAAKRRRAERRGQTGAQDPGASGAAPGARSVAAGGVEIEWPEDWR